MKLPIKLGLALSAMALLATIIFTYNAYHSAAGMGGLVLLAFPVWAVLVVVLAFASGWLIGSVTLYIKARRAGEASSISKPMLYASAMIVFVAIFLGSWTAYEDHLGKMIYNPATTTQQLDALSKNLFVRDSPHLKEHLAGHRSAGPAALARMYASEETAVRSTVCAHPAVSSEVLSQCASETNTEVLYGVAKNPVTPADIVDRLSRHSASQVRSSIGFRTDTKLEIVDRLSRDVDPEVRGSILYHPQLTSELLARMADDPDKLVRARVAFNKKTPLPALLKLAADADSNVRWTVLWDKAPPEVLDALANDPEERIRYRVARLRDRK